MSTENNNVTKYDAFISYRHCEQDKFVAITLHKKLESYRPPKGVISVTGKKRIERVFRDEQLREHDALCGQCRYCRRCERRRRRYAAELRTAMRMDGTVLVGEDVRHRQKLDRRGHRS